MPGQPDPIDGDAFTAAIRQIERAAAMLHEAIAAGRSEDVIQAAQEGDSCPLIIVEAANFLRDSGHQQIALELLERGLALDGPTVLVQHNYARHCRAAGQLLEAARWMRSAMLRNRSSAAMALELCEIELGIDEATAMDMVALAVDLRWVDPPGLKSVAHLLLRSARPDIAAVPLMMLRIRKQDDAEVRGTLSELFDRHGDFPQLPLAVRQRLGLDRIDTGITIKAASAHDRLVQAIGPEAIARARERERSDRWIADVDDIWTLLRDQVARREPFSFVRGGDGEGRFIAAMTPEFRTLLSGGDADAMLRQIWLNWFGQDVGEVERSRLEGLIHQLAQAFANADLVGLTSAAVIDHDVAHVGYRTVLDRWMDGLSAAPGQFYTDASNPLFLHNADPFLRRLLQGERFLGLICPHHDLAPRLGAYLGIHDVAAHIVPGETPLGRPEERQNRGEHFPRVFDRVMAEIDVPFPGACYLIGAGLLGKIYADRVRQLGGIAIDIGALVDGWVGINSRRRAFIELAANPLPSPATAG
nr:hypothetical protein [Sphingomonas sp. Y57]